MVASFFMLGVFTRDYRLYWNHLPYFVTEKKRTRFAIFVFFFALCGQIIVSFFVFGMANLRQIILHQSKNEGAILDPRIIRFGETTFGFDQIMKTEMITRHNQYFERIREWISLPDYLTSAFRIRYDDSCMNSNFNPTPLSTGCLNEIEIFVLTLMLTVFLCAIISSIYFCFLANTQFRLISRSFKDLDDQTADNWPFSTSQSASNKMSGWNLQVNSYGRTSHLHIPATNSGTGLSSSERMSFY